MYTVPLITSTDLRHEETIIQAANALEYLQNVIADVFTKIDNRIGKNNLKIDEIQSRIESANSKIQKLIGSKKAIKIFSPAKFPASHVFRDIPLTFDPIRNPPRSDLKLLAEYEVESSQEPMNQSALQDKLQFYHVRSEKEKSNLSKLLDDRNQGLGPIPRDLISVNSLLLYNSVKNVYSRQAEIYDPKGKPTLNRNENTSGNHKIEAAPLSITNRQIGDKKFNQKLFYTPKLNNAPEINLPVDLPDLPGIAGDIIFEVQEKDKIAPSLFIDNFSKLGDLPDTEIIESSIPKDIVVEQQVVQEVKKNVLPAITSPEAPVHMSMPAVPPPPPPPPAVQEPSISNLKSGSDKNNSRTPRPKAPLPEVPDARSNLMDAIRKAGGVKGGKLRSSAASEVIIIKTSNQLQESKKPAGNLMDDLHNKLMMRRKGISGAKDNQPTGNVMDKLASIIPPPPKPDISMNSSSDASDDDWAD